MEEVFSDALGLFGAEIEEDDRYVYYGELKLEIRVLRGVEIGGQPEPELLFDRLIADGNTCMCVGGKGKQEKVFQGRTAMRNSEIRL